MPKSMRETLSAMISLEMLAQGVYFDSYSILRLPFSRSFVKRTFRALIDARVITRSMPRRKYVFTGGFKDVVKEEITRDMPRGIFVRYPDFAVFDISGIESWTEEEFETYVKRLRKYWLTRRGGRGQLEAGRLATQVATRAG